MTTLNLQVSASADDAWQAGTTVTLTDAGPLVDSTNEWFGFRWLNVTIASGSTISSAVVSVKPAASTQDEPKHTFWCEDADNPGTFTTTSSDISSRARTAASVLWDSADLGASGTSWHSAPDMATAVQEVIDRGGWASGNSIVVIVNGDADATRDLSVKTYDYAAADAPKLDITYTAGGGSTTMPPRPTIVSQAIMRASFR